MFRNPTTDLIVVLVIVLLIFGPKRLPGLGKQLGTGLREFKESITGENKDEETGSRPEITSPGTSSTPAEPPSAAPTEKRESAEVGSQHRP
jgi:sec-independent protein translocase protein TatA